MATTININESSTYSELDSGNEAVYATAHDKATASARTGALSLGQIKAANQYRIFRGFIYFDASAIPDTAEIISAKLKLTLTQDESDTNFNIVIRKNVADTYPSVPLVTSDFDYTFYTLDGGSINTADIVAGANYIWLNSTGLGWISKTGITKLALISSRDINSTTPDGDEYMGFSGAVGNTVLTITYSIESYPSVTTQATTNVGDTYCTANGTLTDGGLATEWGFEYGESETPTWKISQTGNIGEQAFLLGIPGLEPSTTYYCRAYCTNSVGTGYGDWVTFTTGTLATYGMYEEDNTPTVSFYVRKVGGKWSIKHGPYTEDQVDIEITKILTEGTGKYQIKFESNALCSIACTVMTKMDIKAR